VDPHEGKENQPVYSRAGATRAYPREYGGYPVYSWGYAISSIHEDTAVERTKSHPKAEA